MEDDHVEQGQGVIFAALGKDAKENDSVLMWALHNSRGMRISILHVHQTPHTMPLMGSPVSIHLADEKKAQKYCDEKRVEMHNILDKYIQACDQAGVKAEKVWVEMESIEKGILHLISEHRIKWLVMGAAADKHYSRKMKELRSGKAKYVHAEAPNFCHIWFICKGNLIHTRRSKPGSSPIRPQSPLFQAAPCADPAWYLISRSFAEGGSSQMKSQSSTIHHRRVRSANPEMQYSVPSSGSGGAFPLNPEDNTDSDGALRRNPSAGSYLSEGFDKRLERVTEEAAKKQRQLDEVQDQLRVVQEQKLSLQHQIEETDRVVEKLTQKIVSAVELMQKFKKERDEFEVGLDDALREAEELREKADRASSSSMCQFFSEFSLSEIEEATNNFSESLKIGQGGYGGIYRGILRHTEMAIKVLYPGGLQGPVEFGQEVNILSRLRHPNIVNLVGACPEAYALIYEYLPLGNLEDRLNCKNNTPPLSWKTRVHIAADLCSALIFLHSCRPQGIVHGDLKPSNILLDANFVCKLGDFGICRQLIRDDYTGNNATQFWRTDRPKGTPVYIDPEYLATGELTSKSDVYSFGIILLRLLTGRPAWRIVKEVQSAFDRGHLKELLDPTAGDWPFVQAKKLIQLALSCSDFNRRRRPDLASEVWRVLEPMKIAYGGAVSLRHCSEVRRQIPSYFACPISLELMQDPVMAADGHTYELEAIKGWLERGHNTSPMTDLDLPHCNLLPNHALRSAIQEWLQTSQS